MESMLLNFREFLLSGETGLFVGLKIDPQDAEAIYEWVKKYQSGSNKVLPQYYHITLVSSRSPELNGEFQPLGKTQISVPVSSSTVKLRFMGQGVTSFLGRKSLVLAFPSEWIIQRRQQILKETGIRDRRKRFIPHISLAYGTHYMNLNAVGAFPLQSINITEEFASNNTEQTAKDFPKIATGQIKPS